MHGAKRTFWSWKYRSQFCWRCCIDQGAIFRAAVSIKNGRQTNFRGDRIYVQHTHTVCHTVPEFPTPCRAVWAIHSLTGKLFIQKSCSSIFQSQPSETFWYISDWGAINCKIQRKNEKRRFWPWARQSFPKSRRGTRMIVQIVFFSRYKVVSNHFI